MYKQGTGPSKNPAIIKLTHKSALHVAHTINIPVDKITAGVNKIDLGDGTHCELSYEGETLYVHTTDAVDIHISGDLQANAVSIDTVGVVAIDSDMVLEPKYGMNIYAKNITLNAAIATQGVINLVTTDAKYNDAEFTGTVIINKPMDVAYASIHTGVVSIDSIAKIHKLSAACERMHIEAKSNLIVGTEVHTNTFVKTTDLDEISASFIDAACLLDMHEQCLIDAKYVLVAGNMHLRNTQVTAHECVVDHNITLEDSTFAVGYMINFRHGLTQIANTVIRSKEIVIGKSAELYGMLIGLIAYNDIKVDGAIAIRKEGQVKKRISLRLSAGNNIIVPGDISVEGNNQDDDAIDGYEETEAEKLHTDIPEILLHAGYKVKISGSVVAHKIKAVAHHVLVSFGAYMHGAERISINALTTCFAFARVRSTNIVLGTGCYVNFLSLVRYFNFYADTIAPADLGVSIPDLPNNWRNMSNWSKFRIAIRFALAAIYLPLGIVAKLILKVLIIVLNSISAVDKAKKAYNKYYYPAPDTCVPPESSSLNALNFVLAVKQILFAGAGIFSERDFMNDFSIDPKATLESYPVTLPSFNNVKDFVTNGLVAMPWYVIDSVYSFRAGATVAGADLEENLASHNHSLLIHPFP